MSDQEFDGEWDETTTFMRPIGAPTYADVLALPDGAEVIFLVGTEYHCMHVGESLRESLNQSLADANLLDQPEHVGIAELVVWVHPDDMSDEKRANIAALLLQYEADKS